MPKKQFSLPCEKIFLLICFQTNLNFKIIQNFEKLKKCLKNNLSKIKNVLNMF